MLSNAVENGFFFLFLSSFSFFFFLFRAFPFFPHAELCLFKGLRRLNRWKNLCERSPPDAARDAQRSVGALWADDSRVLGAISSNFRRTSPTPPLRRRRMKEPKGRPSHKPNTQSDFLEAFVRAMFAVRVGRICHRSVSLEEQAFRVLDFQLLRITGEYDPADFRRRLRMRAHREKRD
jgi:hypothetical protein